MTFLGYINELLSSIINYELEEWTSDLKFPYWVGEYQEIYYSQELQYSEYNFTLTGTTKGTRASLEKDKEKIKSLLINKTEKLENGHGIAIFYNNALMIPSQDEQIKRMQINITIKEWGK